MMNAVAGNPHAGVKAGKNRQPWRIKEWMSAKGLGQKDLAEKAEIKAISVVSRTINGGANSRKVLAALKELGCPVKFLALPEEMKGDQ
jgi:transcriptional regulator with XRE-family HTH domain